MNFFKLFSFDKILAKYSLKVKRTILKNFLRGACPRTSHTNAWLRHALHGAKRHANAPTFPKKFLPPPKMKS